MNDLRCASFVLALTAVATLGSNAADAASPARTDKPQSQAAVYSSFGTFVRSLSAARAESYLGRQGGAVQGAGAFDEMRSHLLKLYSGVAVNHTFDLEGQTFDCIPLMQQPAVRLSGLKSIATPPPPLAIGSKGLMQVAPGTRDAFGSLRACAQGTIPMRRITLNDLSRFRTLQDFLWKTPGGGDALPPADSNGHSYATGKQDVKNWGAYSLINLWDTQVDKKQGQTFDLSQNWTTGGTGTATQTAETGWQNYPLHYGTKHTVLFIYYTADGYTKTGCYNLECAGFVQTDNTVLLGGTFSAYSASAGTQYGITVGYYLYNGNWWLFANGVAAGYYPGSLYKRGALAKHADTVTYGGEVCCSDATTWPPMGSGAFANTGFGYAAFQGQLSYFDSAEGEHSPTLTWYTPSPACYTYNETDEIGTSFYLGGPGKKAAKC